jgi:hypothetical protein
MPQKTGLKKLPSLLGGRIGMDFVPIIKLNQHDTFHDPYGVCSHTSHTTEAQIGPVGSHIGPEFLPFGDANGKDLYDLPSIFKHPSSPCNDLTGYLPGSMLHCSKEIYGLIVLSSINRTAEVSSISL